MSNTPETDELRDDIWQSVYVEGQDFMQMLEHSRKLERERDEARAKIITRDRLVEAATILIAAKGRHNTMLAYNGLRDALQSLTNNQNE
jgi:hypothetical protein